MAAVTTATTTPAAAATGSITEAEGLAASAAIELPQDGFCHRFHSRENSFNIWMLFILVKIDINVFFLLRSVMMVCFSNV